MTIAISGTTGITLAGQFDSASSMGFKNRIINGAMVIDQRNAGASITPTAPVYSVDRWQANVNVASKASFDQTTTAPTGFTNSMLVTSLSAYSVAAGDIVVYRQQIEGFNIADLGWGTASAATITVSFWVRSSLTGTFGGAIKNGDNTRSYPFTYTISAANTFEQKTVTVAGDTSGTWTTDNTSGLILVFGIGVGSTTSGTAGAWSGANYNSATGATSVVGTNGATFYITGVQLEKGSTATSFDYRPYGTELALCQRYYYRITPNAVDSSFGISLVNTTTTAVFIVKYPTTMRTTPTALEQSGTANQYAVGIAGANVTCSAVPTYNGRTNADNALGFFTVASGLTVGQASFVKTDPTNGATSYLGWSAEL
jgi:hypothetical protein